ncbi:MAG TPA: hypothetical protein VFH79_00805 [Candidatus Limnocylindria bacterium]|nr:hypothetical protein [Candidatus Limnocylindria bacterium]
MTLRPSTAERLDRAIDHLLTGAPPAVAAATAGLPAPQRALVEAAASVRSALVASVVAPRFEARLGARLSGAATSPWILRHPGRLIVSGAVGSAVGVGVTAYAVWRTTRRAGAAHRLLHR